MTLTEWLLSGILGLSVVRILINWRDSQTIQRMNIEACKRQKEWQDQVVDYRKRELDELIDLAKTGGELEAMVKQVKESIEGRE